MEKERKRNDGKKNVKKKYPLITAAGIMMTAMLGMQVSAAESSDNET